MSPLLSLHETNGSLNWHTYHSGLYIRLSLNLIHSERGALLWRLIQTFSREKDIETGGHSFIIQRLPRTINKDSKTPRVDGGLDKQTPALSSKGQGERDRRELNEGSARSGCVAYKLKGKVEQPTNRD